MCVLVRITSDYNHVYSDVPLCHTVYYIHVYTMLETECLIVSFTITRVHKVKVEGRPLPYAVTCSITCTVAI